MPSARPGPSRGIGTYAVAATWQRVGVVLGVIFCFPFLLTIPGWLALRHRNKWKQGLVPLPKFLIFWGYLMSAIIVVAFVVSATGAGDSEPAFTSVGVTNSAVNESFVNPAATASVPESEITAEMVVDALGQDTADEFCTNYFLVDDYDLSLAAFTQGFSQTYRAPDPSPKEVFDELLTRC
jgi:hypothetical protein